MLGVDFRSAPINIREAFAFDMACLPSALKDLYQLAGVCECVIISTCNRTEIYLSIEDQCNVEHVLNWWQQQRKIDQSDIFPVIYRRNGDDAVKHLMRVAGGLDSMILGEAQILGQIKTSFAMAKKAQTVSRNLVRLFDSAFAMAKEIRTKTAIGKCPVSVAYSAITLAKDSLSGGIKSKKVLILGAGKTAELIAKHILSAQPSSVHIINRTVERAKQLAQKIQGTYSGFENLQTELRNSDVVIAAVHSDRYVVIAEDIQSRTTPLLLIDISVPRAISPEISSLPNLTLYSVDDLEGLIQKNAEARARAAIIAEKIVDDGLARYRLSVKASAADQTICAVRHQAETMISEQLEKSLKRLENGRDPAEVLLHFAHSIKNKWLHLPSTRLREASIKDQIDYFEVAKSLFGLTDISK